MSIEALIVDDQEDMRLLLRVFLGAQDDITVTGEATDGIEAVDAYTDLRPTVIVLDEMMPRMRGLDVVRTLRDRGDEPRVVLCSAHLDTRMKEEASLLGVDRCVSKNDMDGVVAAIRELASREVAG
ncbi:MAG TPA: response regulator [Acidimicrobiales bacterium]|nr:response regulator [Acidimicrobiales bacterium]